MDEFNVAGIVLMLMLGLRHGLDPDHIALIDGMTLQAQQARPRMAPWVGFWFALGHGVVVTIVAMLIALGVAAFSMPTAIQRVADWVPVMLLFLVGTHNLLSLRRGEAGCTTSWRARLLPQSLRRSTHPVAIFFIGVMFATIFETITQAAAWGYIATQQGGVEAAFCIGAVFTVGMLITDTMDSRIMSRLLYQASPEAAMARRRMLSGVVVTLSYAIVFYSILTHFFPAATMVEHLYSGLGALMLAGSGVMLLLQGSHNKQASMEVNP